MIRPEPETHHQPAALGRLVGREVESRDHHRTDLAGALPRDRSREQPDPAVDDHVPLRAGRAEPGDLRPDPAWRFGAVDPPAGGVVDPDVLVQGVGGHLQDPGPVAAEPDGRGRGVGPALQGGERVARGLVGQQQLEGDDEHGDGGERSGHRGRDQPAPQPEPHRHT